MSGRKLKPESKTSHRNLQILPNCTKMNEKTRKGIERFPKFSGGAQRRRSVINTLISIQYFAKKCWSVLWTFFFQGKFYGFYHRIILWFLSQNPPQNLPQKKKSSQNVPTFFHEHWVEIIVFITLRRRQAPPENFENLSVPLHVFSLIFSTILEASYGHCG